jgi:hypothetical protein
VLLPQGHKPLEPLHILPVKMFFEGLMRQRSYVLGIGAEFAAIKAIRGSLPRFILLDRLVAHWAAHWSLRVSGCCNCESAKEFHRQNGKNASTCKD